MRDDASNGIRRTHSKGVPDMSKVVPHFEIPVGEAGPGPEQSQPMRRVKARSLLEKETAMVALKQAFVMLRPDLQWKNPVMFVVLVGAVLTLLYIVEAVVSGSASQVSVSYFIALDVWLFLTVLFANFATALAEARGKAQAESLKKARHDTVAYRLKAKGAVEEVSSANLKQGDRVVVKAGQAIPSMISPSPGIVCPAFTTTRSCCLKSADEISSTAPFALRRQATVSRRVFLSDSAWALPRASARAVAKFANSTVKKSHTSRAIK